MKILSLYDGHLTISRVLTKKTTIPTDSLAGQLLPADYTDAYYREVTTEKTLLPDDLMIGFWTSTRELWWMVALFRLRNFLVRFVGLKGEEGIEVGAFEKAIREGGTYGFTSVPVKSHHETVMMLTDKHLDAWLSVYVAEEGANTEGGAGTGAGSKKSVYLITVVKFKQRLGRVYFFVIRPFHALIVKNLLRRAMVKIM